MASTTGGKPKGSAQTQRAKKPVAPKKPAAPKKKRKLAKKKPRFYWWLIICFVLGLALGAALLWWFSHPAEIPGATKPTPASARPAALTPHAYEEPVNNKLMQVENAIYQALSHTGVAAEKIQLWVDINQQGESARLEINLTEKQSLATIAQALEQALKATPARVAWQKQDGFWHLEVFLDDHLSHQVNLRQLNGTARPPVSTGKPRVAIIVDDIGLNKNALQQLLALDMPLTFSVLPYATDSKAIAQKIKTSGRELWLHLPMEPLGNSDPGPDALYANADKDILIKLTRKALIQVPGAVGVNNHMGSRFTQSAPALAGPLQVLKNNRLMFIDSLTSPQSVAYREAKRMGLIAGQRDIFLDHQVSEEAILRQIRNLVSIARNKGQAIAICHPHAATISALKQSRGWLQDQVELVPASELLAASR